MKIDTIKFSDLLDLGFIRHEMGDGVLFEQTGYYGFCLEMDFDNLDIGIQSGCFVSNEKKEWDFKLYKISSGNTIRPIELIELRPLIEFFRQKSEEMEKIIEQINKA